MALFSTLMTLPVQFIYRYFLIVKNIKLSNKQYTILLLISLFFSSTYTGWCLFVVWPREPGYSKMMKLLMADIYYSKEIPNFVTADISDWPLLANFVWVYVMAGAAYTVIIWSSFKVWAHLKINESHMSLATKDANHQISKTLIMQATLPVVVCLIPIAFTVTMVFARANIDGIGLCFSLFFAWIPIVNTLTTMFVVKSYRKTILTAIHWPTAATRRVKVTGTSAYMINKSFNSVV
uniref:Opsin n=1 Tax=Panagrolaimus sp. PS1159 TaxID=55785 RepID=A0AC35GSI7_9BILA